MVTSFVRRGVRGGWPFRWLHLGTSVDGECDTFYQGIREAEGVLNVSVVVSP